MEHLARDFCPRVFDKTVEVRLGELEEQIRKLERKQFSENGMRRRRFSVPRRKSSC